MICFMYTLAICILAVVALPGDDGKWHAGKYGNTGRYNRPLNEGKYIHIPNPYLHMVNPYNGGYGQYIHQGQDRDRYAGDTSQIQANRYVATPPEKYYKPGNYSNNGTKILDQNHNYKSDGYDFHPDGFLYRVEYTAGVEGFRPKVTRIQTPYSGKWVKQSSR